MVRRRGTNLEFPSEGDGQADAFELLRETVTELQSRKRAALAVRFEEERA